MTVGELREQLAFMPTEAEVLVTLDIFANVRVESLTLVKPNWRPRVAVFGVNADDLRRDWYGHIIATASDVAD